MSLLLDNINDEINKLEDGAYYGKVTAVQGLFIEVSGIRTSLTIGDRCNVYSTHQKRRNDCGHYRFGRRRARNRQALRL